MGVAADEIGMYPQGGARVSATRICLAVEDILGPFAALVDVSGLIYAEPGTGYWITVFALAGMLLLEIAMFLKGRIAGGGQK